ncbi:MAG: hypothetical protein OXU25_09485 [Thaumarchaeota archaeon]|nr:hypothetical protein [Nitrososphaerota archaeon]
MSKEIGRSIRPVVENAKSHRLKTCVFSPNKRRFELCKETHFVYSSIDWEIIPGLRPQNNTAEGYYVPVFFEKYLFVRFRRHKKHAIKGRGHARRIVFSDGSELGYGINRQGKAFCWLGDLDKISIFAQQEILLANVLSDGDVISDFYTIGRLGIVTNPGETKLKNALYDLAEMSERKLGFRIHRMEHVDRNVAEKLSRPKIWNGDLTQALINLNKLCVESIDVARLKNQLHGEPEAVDGLQSLKTLELWIKMRLRGDPKGTMTPFFVLYDWRNYQTHRKGTRLTAKYLKCRLRMGMRKYEENDERLYDLLLEALANSCQDLASKIAELPKLGMGDSEKTGR